MNELFDKIDEFLNSTKSADTIILSNDRFTKHITKIANELFNEALLIEDDLQALIGNYHDTHDLDYIFNHKKEFETRLSELKTLFNLKEDEFFSNFNFEDIKLNNRGYYDK